MTPYFQLEQGSDEWHKIRYGRIGGTLSKGLMVDSDTLKIELLSQRLEPYFPDEEYLSDAMLRGMENEPRARMLCSEKYGIELLQCGWIQSDNELLGISPDGITADLKIACEIKSPEPKQHTETLLYQDIPNKNIHQCLHYFTVNPNLEKLIFMSYRPESKVPEFYKEITQFSNVNLGTAKTKNIKPVWEWVAIMQANAEKLNKEIAADLLVITGF